MSREAGSPLSAGRNVSEDGDVRLKTRAQPALARARVHALGTGDGFRPENLGLDEGTSHRSPGQADEVGAFHFQRTGNVIPQIPEDSSSSAITSTEYPGL